MSRTPNIIPIDTLLSATPTSDEAVSAAQQQAFMDTEINGEAPIRTAMSDLRDASAAYVRNDDVARPDWRPLVESCVQYLKKTSRSVFALTVLTEGLVQLHGLRGLGEGAKLYRENLRKFGDRLRPISQGSGPRLSRHNFFLKAASESIGRLRKPSLAVWNIPLCEVSGRPVGFYDLELLQNGSRKVPTLQAVVQAIAALDPSTPEQWVNDANECLSEIRLLRDAIKNDLGPRGDATGDVARAFGSLEGVITKTIADASGLFKNPRTLLGEAIAAEPKQTGPAAGPSAVPALNAVLTRGDAISALERAAQYFERNDPHSLVGTNLRRAQRWLAASLSDVINEAMAAKETLPGLLKTLGVAPVPVGAAAPAIGGTGEYSGATQGGAQSEGLPSSIETREQAIQTSKDVAQYIDAMEKHSFAKFPLAFAVGIANMPLETILERLVDEGARKELFKELGVSFLQVQN